MGLQWLYAICESLGLRGQPQLILSIRSEAMHAARLSQRRIEELDAACRS